MVVVVLGLLGGLSSVLDCVEEMSGGVSEEIVLPSEELLTLFFDPSGRPCFLVHIFCALWRGLPALLRRCIGGAWCVDPVRTLEAERGGRVVGRED